MDFKQFCRDRCPYRDNHEYHLYRKLEPCINCPVEAYIDVTESNNGANKFNTI